MRSAACGAGRPRAIRRSRTNNTVGALILPWSRSTWRSRSSVSATRQRGFDRVDHLDPAGVAAEAVDRRGESEVHSSDLAIRLPARFGLDERRDGTVEDHREPGILDPPAHDAQRVGPQFLARRFDGARNPRLRADTTAAAAPSPNNAVATIAAGSSLSRRIEIEQVSTVTNSQWVPGSATARRAAVARPVTPPAQPSPNTGTRRMSGRSPSRDAHAGIEAGGGNPGGGDGDHAVDIAWLKSGLVDRLGARLPGTSRRPPRDKDGCAPASHGSRRTSRSERRCCAGDIPALSNTPDSRSNNASRPNISRARPSLRLG